MLAIQRAANRGRTYLDWLDSRHSFSFAGYYDPAHMGVGDLRLINEDRVQPDAGFAMHRHQDMEIITYVLAGALEHRDSLGNGSVIRPGDVQRMSAGTGVLHSEYNHSKSEVVHFLQIWILPDAGSLTPSYEQTHVDRAALRDGLRIIAAPDGRDGSVTIHQDALLYAANLNAGESISYNVVDNRKVYLQIMRGTLVVNDKSLHAGDGAIIAAEDVEISADQAADLLLFDLR